VYSTAYLLTVVLVINLDYSLWVVLLWCIVPATSLMLRQFCVLKCYGSINRSCPIYHQRKSPCHPWCRLTGPPKAVWTLHRRKKFLASHQESNPNSSIIEPVSQSLYLLNCATGSCQYLAEMQLPRNGILTYTLCIKRHL
jgi:hypothetical protein